ncbi:MBL fold metallo-hydrolase [Aneurinibacillus sp. Ricciae_BoGa-3]|uniref:MBL fold metallo-hydrolase n=1 Tax=Aneurinibacillus sp. Ricciae_BoGa-3 TaxID=3022697 RepID=UPI002342479E|nr:MBL fold metallo-hydrolase [Aneurinibacillus sp. Ricciae_BoGa-3]WCK55992.1 MBL fold metallo-hydrolase [Aneurinibacillus sp. Ricciae_BoGa-3]
MATGKRLETNVRGEFYVTNACINCDQCRQLARNVFSEVGSYSAVTKQPDGEEERTKAFHAMVSCPTGAIISEQKEGLAEAINDFPLLVEDNVYYCGFTSRNSYGASSYFITHPEGNWLVDSPRWSPQLASKFEQMGGIHYVFLTHRDDVADTKRYTEKFKAERIIHVWDKDAQPDAEHLIQGIEPVMWQPDFQIIPVPGHTKGHMVLLYREKFLFTGDHLAWDRQRGQFDASEDYCWYSWQAQCESMERLLCEKFEWVLPGHGDRVQLPEHEIKETMNQLFIRMKE